MIVRINFSGIIKTAAGKKKIMDDYLDVHIASISEAKKMWKQWIDRNSGIRGASGVYHPLCGFGEIQVSSFEQPQDD